MNNSLILTYLAELEAHNDRDWFHANKAHYQAANQAFESLVDELSANLRESDESLPLIPARNLTFKLQRDTRFSHDKSPYNPAFRAHIASRGKLPIPVGYFLYLQPGGRSFLGGGLFADQFPNATRMVRDAIVQHGDELATLLSHPDFSARFTMDGTKLKKVPQGYDPNHPQSAYLKHKSFYLEFPVTDEQAAAPDFASYAAGVFTCMRPFNAFLNRALEGFEMPSR